MPSSNKEKLIFTLIMAFFMVGAMALSNAVWFLGGFSFKALERAFLGGVKEYPVAVVIVYFFTSKAAFALAKKFFAQNIGLGIPICTVLMMVPIMTTIINIGFMGLPLGALPSALVRNYCFAFPLQLFIVGPFVRKLFGQLISRALI